jgi:hypothetical protein
MNRLTAALGFIALASAPLGNFTLRVELTCDSMPMVIPPAH